VSTPLLEVDDLAVVTAENLAIIEDVSFSLGRGEVLGLVGESGSGKSMSCRALMRLLPSESLRIAKGTVRFEGIELLALDECKMRGIRGRRMGMIFQNPASHLDPVMSIGQQIAETLRFHRNAGRRAAWREAIEMLRQVGIPDPERRARDYAHQFSGGMRQRAMIALVLACGPNLIIADEPTTALDVTVQAQIVRLLLDLRDRHGVSIILITHDLGLVAQTCDAIAVMYAGRICERGVMRDVLARPLHPYTRDLIACQPATSRFGSLLPSIPGQPPLPTAYPPGCRFNPRCAEAITICREICPTLHAYRDAQVAACHLAETRALTKPPQDDRTATS
jgi:peptide/nickel transport system ATP-binding protein